VVGYNYIQRAIRGKEDELTSFGLRFRNRVVERTYVEMREGAAGLARGGDLVSPSLGSK
jgi:hypothetical protein